NLHPQQSGEYLVQVQYGKIGTIETGITAAVKQLEIIDVASNEVVGKGIVTMPHLGKSEGVVGESTSVLVSLQAGHSYLLRISDSLTGNMSSFQHFAGYTGPGGKSGPDNSADIKGVKLSIKPVPL